MAQKCRFSQVIWDEVRQEKRKRLFFLRFSRLVVCCVPSLSWQIIAGVHKKNSGNSLLFWFWFLVLVCRVLISFFPRWNMSAISHLVGGGSPASRKPIASGAAVPADSFNSNLPLYLDPYIDIYIYGVFVAWSRWGASLGVFTGHSETVLHANVTEDDNQPLWWCGTKSHTRHFKHTCGANVV